MRWIVGVLSLTALAVSGGAEAREKRRFVYPETDTVDVVDDYHGTKVADPYRWLEDDARTSEKVASWVEAQNDVTFAYLKSIPSRRAIEKRLRTLWDYERYSSPSKVGGHYYWFKNDGLQNQSILYRSDSVDGEPEVVLDPNGWADDGTVALAGLSFSPDGRYAAFARSVAGSDWREWFVLDLERGVELGDKLEWTKFTSASWTADSRGFFYGRFAAPVEGEEFQALNENMKIYYHRVGTTQSDDVLVFHRPDEPKWGFFAQASEDGRWLVIHVQVGTDSRNRVFYKDLLEPYGMPVELISSFDHEFSFLGNDGSTFYFKTDLDAPNRRIVAIDVKRPDRSAWREVVPEAKEPLRSADFVGNMIVTSYLEDATTRVRMFRPDGSHVRDVDFPVLGTASGFGGKRSDTETFYSFSSFNVPPSIYRYDLLTGKSSLFRRSEVDVDPDRYAVKQVFYESKDGTKVPMFVAHRKDLPIDGNRPTLLYGYGGFNVSLTPYFSVVRMAWMEMGGVFALANLRGGGEYGRTWHEAGKKENKQNVFDDFIAAGEWLIANRYTNNRKLAIQGGSNGGLLVGACMAQRPDLFAAALPAVGVMDMLRFDKFTAGRYWVDDYGSADDPEEFRALYAYSPYHNLEKGKNYPATLITTADTDDRVVPGHSFKFAARLQRMHEGSNPVMIRIETRAGHGGGKPTEKRIEEAADLFAFLVDNLEMKPTLP